MIVEEPHEEQSESGAVELTWCEVDQRWMQLLPLSGREYWSAQQVKAETTHKAICRYSKHKPITPRHRLKLDSRVFQITSVINVEERNEELQLMLVEVLPKPGCP